MYSFRLKLTEYYWCGLKQCIPRVFDDFLIRPKTRLMGPPLYESINRNFIYFLIFIFGAFNIFPK